MFLQLAGHFRLRIVEQNRYSMVMKQKVMRDPQSKLESLI